MCVHVYVYAEKNNSSIIFCFITVCFFLGLGAEISCLPEFGPWWSGAVFGTQPRCGQCLLLRICLRLSEQYPAPQGQKDPAPGLNK